MGALSVCPCVKGAGGEEGYPTCWDIWNTTLKRENLPAEDRAPGQVMPDS